MARPVRSAIVLLSLAFGASCDSDEPLQVGIQNVDVAIIPSAAQVDIYVTWEVSEDSDGQPGADDVNGDGIAGDMSLWCESAGLGFAPSVPWTYSVQLSVVRAGSSERVPLTSENAATADFNRGAYDENETPHGESHPSSFPLTHVRGACTGNNQIKCNPASSSTLCQNNGAGICAEVFGCQLDASTVCDPTDPGTTCNDRGAGFCLVDGFCSRDPGIACEPTCGDLQLGSCISIQETRTFQFASTSRRRLSGANRELLRAADNLIYDTCVGDLACIAQIDTVLQGSTSPELGRCPGQDLEDPGFDPGNPLDLNADPVVFGLQLDKGDRLIVEARRSDTVPGGGQVIIFHEFPGIRAAVSIDGIILGADEIQCGQGSCSLSSVSGDPSPNVSFSFTTK
jgi:hypothetical protein